MSTAIPAAALEAPVPAKEIPPAAAVAAGHRRPRPRAARSCTSATPPSRSTSSPPSPPWPNARASRSAPRRPNRTRWCRSPSLAEVSHRSVIPFGIEDPVPLYHDFLWARRPRAAGGRLVGAAAVAAGGGGLHRGRLLPGPPDLRQRDGAGGVAVRGPRPDPDQHQLAGPDRSPWPTCARCCRSRRCWALLQGRQAGEGGPATPWAMRSAWRSSATSARSDAARRVGPRRPWCCIAVAATPRGRQPGGRATGPAALASACCCWRLSSATSSAFQCLGAGPATVPDGGQQRPPVHAVRDADHAQPGLPGRPGAGAGGGGRRPHAVARGPRRSRKGKPESPVTDAPGRSRPADRRRH